MTLSLIGTGTWLLVAAQALRPLLFILEIWLCPGKVWLVGSPRVTDLSKCLSMLETPMVRRTVLLQEGSRGASFW